VFDYEATNRIKVNKEQIYFAMSVNALNSGDEINTLSYWELAQKQHGHAYSKRPKPKAFIERLTTHYTAVTSSVEHSYDNLPILSKIRRKYPDLNRSLRP